MKKITSLITAVLLTFIVGHAFAQETCSSTPSFVFYTSNAGWTASDYYQIINIDAATLTDQTLPQTSALDGTQTSSNFGTGTFNTAVLTTTDGTTYTPTGLEWPVTYYMSCFAPTYYNSAYTKVNVLGTNPSHGSPVECTSNDNSVVTSPIWDKQGYIELSRQGSADSSALKHGYLEIDNLPQVERVQWSFSSTAYKRGVKLDINYNDGNGWQPLQWEASGLNNYATFAEQGYEFENMINKQDDPSSTISLRWRIWDGDSIHINPMTTSVFTDKMYPYAQEQVVRIHQIKIFSGIVPDHVYSAVVNPTASIMNIYVSGSDLVLSEKAKVAVYSILGKNMYNGYTNKVDVSSYPSGLYIVKAENAKGQIMNKKIML